MCDTASRAARCAVGLKRIRPILRGGLHFLPHNGVRGVGPIPDDSHPSKTGDGFLEQRQTFSAHFWDEQRSTGRLDVGKADSHQVESGREDDWDRPCGFLSSEGGGRRADHDSIDPKSN